MNTKQSETLLNDSRERQSRKIHRNRGTISIRRNDKGIPHFCLHNFKVKLSFERGRDLCKSTKVKGKN